MQSFPALRDSTNPYLKQLFGRLSGYVDVQTFSWSDALLGRFDVLHVHWPEVMIRGRSPLKTAARRAAFLLLMLRIRWGRHALVRTLHNVTPHETSSRLESWLLRLCDQTTALFITLLPSTPVPVAGTPSRVILHGDYREWFEAAERPDPHPGRLLYFGLIRRYKGVDDALRAFAELTDDDAELRIVGGVRDGDLADSVRRAVADDHRVSAQLEYVSDAQLAAEVGGAQLVVLPYRDMHNSGAALLALSLDRPVLVPRNDVTVALAAEVGEPWVRTFEGQLTGGVLSAALTAAGEALRGPRPDLSARNWDVVAALHADAYAAAFDGRRT